jgi:hypothetical protein
MGRALRAGLRRNEWPRRNRALGRAICRLETVFEHADHDHYAAGSSGDNVGSPHRWGKARPPHRVASIDLIAARRRTLNGLNVARFLPTESWRSRSSSAAMRLRRGMAWGRAAFRRVDRCDARI